MKYNIAVQIFGQLRMWENSEQYREFFDFLNTHVDSVDVFGSFWWFGHVFGGFWKNPLFSHCFLLISICFYSFSIDFH